MNGRALQTDWHSRRTVRRVIARRSGAVLIAVMMCLAVITLLLGVLFKSTLASQRQQRIAEWRRQAEWLAESGLERAHYRLTQSAEYAGETCEIADGVFGPAASGTVAIEVVAVESEPERRVVRVRSEYFRDGVRRVRFTREIEMHIGKRPAEARS